jgi:hypothetical protein
LAVTENFGAIQSRDVQCLYVDLHKKLTKRFKTTSVSEFSEIGAKFQCEKNNKSQNEMIKWPWGGATPAVQLINLIWTDDEAHSHQKLAKCGFTSSI